MFNLLLPVLLSALNPGFGQLYNRDYRKGWILMLSSLTIFLFFLVWFGKVLALNLPPDLNPKSIDPATLKPILAGIQKNYFWTYTTYTSLLIGLWIFGMLDAYAVARRRGRGAPRGDSSQPDNEEE